MSVLQFRLFLFLFFYQNNQSINRVRLLLDVTGGLIVSSDSPLDFHDEIYHLLAITLRYLFIG